MRQYEISDGAGSFLKETVSTSVLFQGLSGAAVHINCLENVFDKACQAGVENFNPKYLLKIN